MIVKADPGNLEAGEAGSVDPYQAICEATGGSQVVISSIEGSEKSHALLLHF